VHRGRVRAGQHRGRVAVNRQGRLPGLPRFAATSPHRSVALLAVTFVAVHIGTAIADPFVSIGIAAAVVPFVSPYQPFWLGSARSRWTCRAGCPG
jgi:methionine sulfoxide reductase heme-binding subunit